MSVPDLEGAAAVPRANGEPVFEAPWQSRAFGMVALLYEQGRLDWDEFRRHLVANIAGDHSLSPSRYWEHWVSAFHDTAVEQKLLGETELALREQEFRVGTRRDVY